MAVTTGPMPQITTKTVSRMKGIQAQKSLPGVRLPTGAFFCSGSPSYRHNSLGCQI